MPAEQLSFDLGPLPRPEATYFALRPDASAGQAMLDLAQWYRSRCGLTGRPYDIGRLHVSLFPAVSRRGWRKDDATAAMRAAVRVRAAPFPVAFERICTFAGRDERPVVLCCNHGAAELSALRDALRGELSKEGLWSGAAGFQPHVTLLWDRRGIQEACLREPVRWTVESFVLIRSLIGQGRQLDLGRWPLRDGPTSSHAAQNAGTMQTQVRD